ncbi:MAG TPA: protease inhibitor I9 family protein [Nitrososphaeraceae archaeon]|nr:protease inhibitor I9 family protein [Nitrososphaeraceae archaeon]
MSMFYFAFFSVPSISSEIYAQSQSFSNDDNIQKNQINAFDIPKIPNQYIVVFKDDVKNPYYLINQIGKRIETSTFKDLDILNIFQNSIKGSLTKINTQSELDKLRHDPNVKYVEQDQKI